MLCLIIMVYRLSVVLKLGCVLNSVAYSSQCFFFLSESHAPEKVLVTKCQFNP